MGTLQRNPLTETDLCSDHHREAEAGEEGGQQDAREEDRLRGRREDQDHWTLNLSRISPSCRT